MSDYQDKVVLITGASGGIGKACAEAFAQQGAKISICDRNGETLQVTAAEFREKGYTVYDSICDVTQEEQVKAFIEGTLQALGQLDIAVNNAGVEIEHAKLADVSTEAFDTTMAVNVRGVFHCMKYQLPALQKHGGGSILNVASVAGLVGAPFMSHYAASKHAVIGLTRSAAAEYACENIRVNAVCPFITHTDMLERVLELAPDREEAIKSLGKGTPIKRVAQPSEVVHAILLACDPKNTYMTGAEIKVDGGFTGV